VRGQGLQHGLLKKFGIVALALVDRALGGEEEVGEVAIGAGVIFGICCTSGGGLRVLIGSKV